MKNNVIFNLKQSIGIGFGKGTRIRVSEDYETGKVINTSGEIVSVVLKNDTQIERFEASFSDGFMIIEKRGLNKEKVVAEDETLKKQWNEGEMGYITVFAHNLFDASKSITIKEGEKIYFGSNDVYLTQNDGNLKIKDRNNNEISLSDIASKTGQNNKVSISDEDLNAGFLKDKLGKGFKFGSKVDVDYGAIDLSQVQEETLSENTYVLTENKKKTKIFKKENLNLLNEKIGNIKAVAGENINRGDLVYFFPDNEFELFETTGEEKTTRAGSYSHNTISKKTQKIRIKNSDFKITKLGVYVDNNNLDIKIYKNYNFADMTGSDMIFSKTISGGRKRTEWLDISLDEARDYYIEAYNYYGVTDLRDPDNNSFIDFLEYKGQTREGAIVDGARDYINGDVDSCFITGLKIKLKKQNIFFKDKVDFLPNNRNDINFSDIFYDGVAVNSANSGQEIDVKVSGVLPKNIINFSGKKVGEELGNYLKIGVFGNGKTFKDFIK